MDRFEKLYWKTLFEKYFSGRQAPGRYANKYKYSQRNHYKNIIESKPLAQENKSNKIIYMQSSIISENNSSVWNDKLELWGIEENQSLFEIRNELDGKLFIDEIYILEGLQRCPQCHRKVYARWFALKKPYLFSGSRFEPCDNALFVVQDEYLPPKLKKHLLKSYYPNDFNTCSSCHTQQKQWNKIQEFYKVNLYKIKFNCLIPLYTDLMHYSINQNEYPIRFFDFKLNAENVVGLPNLDF